MSDSLQPHEFAVHQASLSITSSRSLLKLMPIKSVMPSSQLILCHPLLFVPPIPPSIRVFSNELFVWADQGTGVSASASVLPMNTQIVATYLIKNIRYLFAEWVDVWMMSGWMDGCSWSLYVEFVTNHSPPLFFSLLFHSARLLRILFSHRTQQSYVHPSCCDLSSIHLMESVISKADSDLFLSWLRHKIYVCILLITLECLCFVSSWITYPTFI